MIVSVILALAAATFYFWPNPKPILGVYNQPGEQEEKAISFYWERQFGRLMQSTWVKDHMQERADPRNAEQITDQSTRFEPSPW